MAKLQEGTGVEAVRARLRAKYDASVAPTVEDMVPRPLPTGIPQLDDIIGIGGLPRGRIIDLFGQEAVGKTALCMLIAKNLLRINPSAQIAWLDVEHKLSTSLAEVIGLDLKKVLVVHPPSAEESFDLLLDLIADFDSIKKKGNNAGKSPKPLDVFDFIIFDSVAAAVSQAELMADAGDVVVAPIAKLMADSLKKMLHPLFLTRTCVLFINQMRSTPMVRTWGNQIAEKPTGGKALAFYASVRLEIKKSVYIKENDKIVGLKNEVETVKNGVAAPFQTACYDFNFEHGIDVVNMLVEDAIASHVITTRGSYFIFGEGDDAIQWQGKKAMLDAFRSEELLFAKLQLVLKRQ